MSTTTEGQHVILGATGPEQHAPGPPPPPTSKDRLDMLPPFSFGGLPVLHWCLVVPVMSIETGKKGVGWVGHSLFPLTPYRG